MEEERKMNAAANRYAELKQALDQTPLWAQLEHAARTRELQVVQGIAGALDDLAWLVTRPEGWLRITNTDDGARVHYKFKFVDTAHWNTYVYYVTEGPRLAEGLDGLRRKVEQVLRGERKPTKDKPYDHR
jgi:hypothetical protein